MPDWNELIPEPTSLIALWPHAAPPALADVVAALARHLGDASVLETLPADGTDLAFSAVLSLPREPSPVVLWLEAAQPLSDHERGALGITDCPWALGVQTQLDRADPLTAFHHLVATIAGALPDVPAVLDVDTTRWYPRSDLESMFSLDGIEPGADVLWTIQLVEGRAVRSGDDARVWLHTHGLRRCGRPELEMLEVPAADAPPAADLLQNVAGLLFERVLPAPGGTLEIGPDLLVSLQRWEDVAPFLAEGVPGGLSDRAGAHEEGHAGASAVVCAPVAEGVYRKLWTWPREAVQQCACGEATVFVTTRATERQAALARAAWAQFVEAFDGVSERMGDAAPGAMKFGVKAGFSDDHARGREHLWFEVRRAEAGRVEGQLMHEPVAVKHLRAGDRTWIDLEHISDWRVVTARGAFGPDEVSRLPAALGGDEPLGDEPLGDEPLGDEPLGDEPLGDDPLVDDPGEMARGE